MDHTLGMPGPGCTRPLLQRMCGRGRPAFRDPALKGNRQHPGVKGGSGEGRKLMIK